MAKACQGIADAVLVLSVSDSCMEVRPYPISLDSVPPHPELVPLATLAMMLQETELKMSS